MSRKLFVGIVIVETRTAMDDVVLRDGSPTWETLFIRHHHVQKVGFRWRIATYGYAEEVLTKGPFK